MLSNKIGTQGRDLPLIISLRDVLKWLEIPNKETKIGHKMIMNLLITPTINFGWQ